MENTTLIALSRQAVLRRQMDVVAHNLANMNTNGFKGEKMMFIQHEVRSRGGERILGDRINFVRDIATARDTREGPVTKTGNPLDVAVRGDGYLVVDTVDGERYTRNGRLRLDEAGQLVTQGGHPVLAEGNQPIFFSPADSRIDIARDGTVSTDNGEIGRLRVVSFENAQQLQEIAGGLLGGQVTPEDVEQPDVVQGMLEGSNVEPIVELTRMIQIHRAYEGAKRLIKAEDERIKTMVKEMVKEA